MSINDYLGELGEQKYQEEKKIDVVESEGVKELCGFYYNNNIDVDLSKIGWVKNAYTQFLEKSKDLNYSSKDLKDFSILLKRYENEVLFPQKAGLILSALINNSDEENFEVITEHLPQHLNFLGYKNTKNITVLGNGGIVSGWNMEKGSITVKGDADDSLGSGMINGIILVEGNSQSVGMGMKGGKIEVKGTAYGYILASIGFGMRDGLIVISKAKEIDLGSRMMGGSMIIENADMCKVGEEMLDGVITVNSGVASKVGEMSTGGRIEINGEIKRIFKDCKAEIYHNGKRLSTTLLNRIYYNQLRKNDRIKKLFE